MSMPSRESDVHDARGNDSEEEDPYRGEEVERKFRFCSRSAFLTYPRCPILPGAYLKYSAIPVERIKTAFGKQESHRDGTKHLHVWITFLKKIDTINPRFFDLIVPDAEGAEPLKFHCNIRRESRRKSGVHNAIGAYDYLCKYDGVVPVDIVGSATIYPTPRNFRKEYGDRTQWLNYLAVRAMQDPVCPIPLPQGDQIPVPDPNNKRRHLWIYGPPNAGKTLWLETNVLQFRNYRISGTVYPYGNYDGEQIIIYDDITPKAGDLLSICNTSAYPRPVPGQTRYGVRYVPGKLVTLVIVCSNLDIDTVMNAEAALTRDAIHKRFIEIELVAQDEEL